MEPPLSATPNLSYQESNESSPRSRTNETWDDPLPPVPGAPKLRLMCSYGGHIVPRPHDKSLCYVGGDTRMVVVDRNTSLSDLSYRLSKNHLHSRSFILKYQIPNEDLDSLISVTTDEDLDNMIDEYDRLCSNNSSIKSSRVRLFLFPTKSESVCSSIGSLLDNSSKSEDWFFSALNGETGVLNRGFSDSQAVNCLFGLDNDGLIGGGGEVHGGNEGNLGSREPESAQTEVDGCYKNVKQGGHDVHSVPNSPMLDTTSSFGSTSSSPSLANLPPIRVQVEEGGSGVLIQDQKLGIEEQFAQISVSAAQKQYDGFVGLSSPPPPMPTSIITPTIASTIPITGGGVEYQNRVFSDDERSDQGIPVGYRRPPQPQPQPQSQSLLQLQTLAIPQQSQQKPTGGVELPSPDSVSSDGSLTNAMYRQNPMIYQELVPQKPLNIPDPNITTRIQMQQQFQESPGYIMQSQLDQQQQFIHGGQHYIQHHHPSGQVPISSYYPVYPPQQNQQYPVYYMPARQPQQPYNISMQQPNFSDAMPSRNAPPPRTATGPPLAQVGPTQHQQQYVGYSQIHPPPQSMNPNYEYADPSHSQIYYTQPYPPTFPAQFQTMTSALPEASSQPLVQQMKQQTRTS